MDSEIVILMWVIAGLISGWMASAVMKGSHSHILGDLFLGVVGALTSGLLSSVLPGIAGPTGGINGITIVVSFVGAVIAIVLVRVLSDRRATV